MKVTGAVLSAIGILGFFNSASNPPPGTDPAEALGMMLGPFLFAGLGGYLLWKAHCNTAASVKTR